MILLNVGLIKEFKLLVLVWLVISDLYVFHVIVLLNSPFNCSKKLLSSSVGKITTWKYNFVSVILNVASVGGFTAGLAESKLGLAAYVKISVKTHFSDHFRAKDTKIFHSY